MALEKPRDIYTHDLSDKNLTAGEGSNATKRVDGAFFDANYEDINHALGVRQAWGADFIDEGSAAAEGYYSIDPAGTVDAEHYVVVSDGTSVWKVKAFADDEIKIDDDDIVNGGAGPADYSASAFIESLHLWVDKTEKAGIFVDKTQIVTTHDAPNALTGAEISRSSSDSSDLDTDLTAVEDDFAAEHTAGTGAHQAGFLTASMLSTAAVFADEGFKNILRNGGFERWPQGPNAAPESEYWEADSATIAQESTTVLSGDYSMKIIAMAGDRGVKYSVPNYTDYQGKTITVAARVKRSAAGDVYIKVDDGVGTTSGTAVTLSSSWQTMHCTRAVDASATELTIYFYASGGAATWFMDEACAVIGTTVQTYESSTHDDIAEDDVVPVNWLLNPGFETYDMYGTATADSGYDRDYWVKYGLGSLQVGSVTSSPLSGHRSISLEGDSAALGSNTGIKQDIGDLSVVRQALAGKTVCFSAWFYVPSSIPAANTWRLEIYDGATTTYTEFEASDLTADTWTQLAVVADLRAAMSTGDLVVRIYSVDGEDMGDEMHIDGACLNEGSRPMPGAGYGEKSAWTRVTHVFQNAGALAGDAYVGLWQPVVRTFYPTKIDVYCGTGPENGMGGTAEYTLHSGSYGSGESADNLSCTLTAAASADADGQGGGSTNTLANANTDLVNYGSYIRVYQDQSVGNTDPEDITVIITGFSVID